MQMLTSIDKKDLLLTPILHGWVTSLLNQGEVLENALREYGSPLNVHSLQPFTENIEAYSTLLQQLKIKHRIYFARKANKCVSFAKRSAELGHGVDTASYRELLQCLNAGIPPNLLISTAAVKNRKLLELAVAHGVTVVIDNRDELDLLKAVADEQRKEADVNIRLGGFELGSRKLSSRFGFLPSEALELIKDINENEVRLTYSGLQFHLNGYSIEDRAFAIENCIVLIDELAGMGIRTQSLDIGGGFLMNYLAEKEQWDSFHRELKLAVLGRREALTYQNDPLGIVKIADELFGEPTVYPYYNEINKVSFLEAVLTSTSEKHGSPIHELIVERNLELRIEPGRSLLDQAGITVARVAFRKKDSDGNLLIGLEMNRTQLRSSSADFLLDPIHLSGGGSVHQEANVHYGYLVGAYCLEQELILKRKVKFEWFPAVGDLFVFPNTAGYMMHFFESEAHLFELARNVFLDSDSNIAEDIA